MDCGQSTYAIVILDERNPAVVVQAQDSLGRTDGPVLGHGNLLPELGFAGKIAKRAADDRTSAQIAARPQQGEDIEKGVHW